MGDLGVIDMSFFSFFSNNSFKNWPRYERLSPLQVNLCDLSLNGIKIGDNWNELIKIGKPDNNNALKINQFKYQNFGCRILITDDMVDLFDIAVSGQQYDDLVPNEIDLICEDGINILLNDTTMISDLVPHLGNEVEKDVCDDEINLVYEGDLTVLQIDCSLDNIIKRIVIEGKIMPEEIKHVKFNKLIRVIYTLALSLCLLGVILLYLCLFKPYLPVNIPHIFLNSDVAVWLASLITLFFLLLRICSSFTRCPRCHRFIFGRYKPKPREKIKFKCQQCKIILVTDFEVEPYN